MESLRQIINALRDLIVPLLPDTIVRLMFGKIDFVFLVHPIDIIDLKKKYPFLRRVSKKYIKVIARYLWPVIGPKLGGFNSPTGPLVGLVVFSPFTTRMMLLKKDKAKKSILRAAKLSKKIGARMLGLGAFVSIVTDDGVFLSDKVDMSITTGTAYAAVIAYKNILGILEKINVDPKNISMAIVGAGGSVGSICAKLLIEKFKRITLVDRNLNSLISLTDEMKGIYKDISNVKLSDKVGDINSSDIILVITNVPGAVIKPRHLKQGAIVVDAAFPKNVSEKVLNFRKDVLVIDSGIAEVEGFKNNFRFGLGIIEDNDVFSCLAEELILLWLWKEGKFIGKIDIDYVMELLRNSESAGVRLPKFRNSLGYISYDEISKFKQFIVIKA